MIIYKNKKLVLPVGLAPNITATQAGIFNQDKTADSSSNFQVITYDAALGFTGLGSVTINPYTTEEKTVDSSIAIQIVTGDNGPLSKVTVNPYVLGSLDLDSSTARQEYSGAYSNVVVKPYTLEEVTVDSSTNPQVITSEADGLSKVNINPYVLSPLEVDSSTATQELTGSYSSVKVNPYTLDSSAINITENGEYSVTSEADGLSRVDVSVNIDTSSYFDAGVAYQKSLLDSSTLTANGTYTRENGWNRIDVSINTVNNQDKRVDSSTVGQTITPDEGYTGLGEVRVSPYVLDTSTLVAKMNGDYTVYSSKDGLSRVDVSVNINTESYYYQGKDAGIAEQKAKLDSSTILENGHFTRADGWNDITVRVAPQLINRTVDSSTVQQVVTSGTSSLYLHQVTVNPYTLDSSYMTITQTGLYSVTAADMGVDGLSRVDVDVQGGGGNPEAGQGDPSTGSVTYYPNYPYDSFSEFTVNAVDASIDSNIQPDNIKAGVNILGVHGTYEGSDGAVRLEYISNENSPTLAFDSSYIPGKKTKIIAKLSFGGQGQSFWGVYMGLQDVWNLREISGYGTNDLAFQTEADDPRVNDAYPAPDDFSTIHEVYFGTYAEFTWDEQQQTEVWKYWPFISDSSVGYDYDQPHSDPMTTDRFNYSMYIFAGRSNDDGTLTEYTGRQMRLHEMTILELDESMLAEVEVMHLLPYQDASGNVCLYDTIGENYIYAFSGTPGAGPTMKYQKKEVSCSDQEQLILPDNGFPAMSQVTILAADRNIDPMIREGNIKSGITILGCTGTYTGSQFYRLEWASNGDRCLYRDTGINVTEDTYIECTLSFGDQQTEQVGYGYFWGVRDSNFGGQCFNMREFGGYGARQVQFNNPSWPTWTQDLPHAPRTWTFGQMDPDGTGQNNYSFYRYNGVIDKRDPYTITDGYSINTIYLWAQNNDGQGVDEYSDREVRIHEFKVWQNGQLVRHIVPVTSDDGGPEMFDLINMEVLPGEGYLFGGPRYEEVDLDNYIENGVYDGSVGNVYFNIGPYLYDFTNKSAYSDQYLEIVASLPEAPTTLGGASAYTLFGCRNSRNDEGVLVDYELAYPLYGGLPTIDCTAGDQSDSWVDSSTSNGLHTIELTSCYAHGGASNTCQTALILDGIPKMVEHQLSNSSDNNDNYIFACHSIAAQGLDTVTRFSMTGTRIYKITYYNCDDGVLHVLVPAYNNGQYCFLDKSTETYIYASAGTPTGYIKNKYYDDCVDIHDNRT